jgi:hypothetical protein
MPDVAKTERDIVAEALATEAEIADALHESGMAPLGETPRLTTISGGVSSAVYRANLASLPVCAKRALAQLKVTAVWKAPLERSLSEINWIETVARLDEAIVPKILHVDAERDLFIMNCLDPEQYPCWKLLLIKNAVGADFAVAVGSALGRIHAHTARSTYFANWFDNSALFDALRVEPYLVSTANVHQDLREVIRGIASTLIQTRIAVVQGGISPKKILKGPAGPVFLDAECATYGDPAFDLAFCLNYLFPKCLWHPIYSRSYIEAFDMLLEAYFCHLSWKERRAFDACTARLLGALLLARVDGKSPAEYLTEDRQREFVRLAARTFLADAELDLARLRRAWPERLGTQ